MKISLIIVTAVVLIFALIYTMPVIDTSVDGISESAPAASSPVAEGTLDESKKALEVMLAPDDLIREKRRSEMQETFTKLQQSRKQLKSQANLLKSRVWGLQLPPQQARDISNKMRQVFVYLKNPAMLGAYFEADEIRNESRKVAAMQGDLAEVEQLISALRERDQ